MKIKLFSDIKHADLEKKVNDFIESDEVDRVIDIKYQSFPLVHTYTATGAPHRGDIVDRVMIIYEEAVRVR